MPNLSRGLSVAIGATIALSGIAGALGARINTTGSFPPGLYWMTGETATKGALVIACPPPVAAVAEGFRRGYIDAGFCPGGYGYVIKKILGLRGLGINGTENAFKRCSAHVSSRFGSRKGRNAPFEIASGNTNRYRPSRLICSKPKGESRATSSSRTGWPSWRSCVSAASI
jgi:type IV secretory pathway protease TraF